MTAVAALEGALVVSCQSSEGSPVAGPAWISQIATAAIAGGAGGLRVNGVEDLAAVRSLTDVPIIGLDKSRGPRRRMITMTVEAAMRLREAGADVVAVDATDEAAAEGREPLRAYVELGWPIMADVSTVDEGLRAADAGAALIGSTLSGYTPQTRGAAEEPDLDLVAALARRGIPVVAEGRFRSPEQVRAAFDAGAYAVVVGGAITDPFATTARFVRARPEVWQ